MEYHGYSNKWNYITYDQMSCVLTYMTGLTLQRETARAILRRAPAAAEYN